MGWTGRLFCHMYNEHYKDIKVRNSRSDLARLLIESNYSVDCIENIMNIVHITKKGAHMSTSEEYYIRNETQKK
jgi:hypothetical protein